MCGIAGFFTTHPERVRPYTLQTLSRRLLLEIENRGRDATGYAYVSLRDKAVYLAKAPVPAGEFLKINGHILTKPGIKKMPRGMLLHTRAATQGTPNENKNNHPVYTKASGLCMVHNGWISNDDQLVKEHTLEQDAEVDTEVYLRLIEKYYLQHPDQPVESSIKQATGEVWGSVACAMIQAGRTDTMWVWRDQGALAVAYTDWGVVFASTRDSLLRSLMGSCSSFDLPSFTASEPGTGTLLTMSMKGLPKVREVAAADWAKLPDNLSGRVYRTFIGGKLSRVRRATRGSGSVTYFHGSDLESDDLYDYYGGYEGYQGRTFYHGNSGNSNNGNSAPTNRDKLPYFSQGRAPSSNVRTQAGADQESYSRHQARQQESRLPNVAYVDRKAIEDLRDKERPRDCFCRLDYCCMRCAAKHEYFGVEIDKIPETLNATKK